VSDRVSRKAPWGRSLRFKLTLWFVLVFSLLQTGLVGGTVFLRREFIKRALESDLERSAGAMVDSILATGVERFTDIEDLGSFVPANSGFLLGAIRDSEGTIQQSWNVSDLKSLRFTFEERVQTGPFGAVFTTLSSERAESLMGSPTGLRLVTVPFRKNEELYFFQAAVRDQVLESLLGPLDIVLVGLPLAVIAATIAAWVIGGKAVAPIQRLARAVGELSPRSLGARFRTRSTHTEIGRLEDELNSALERLEGGYRAQAQFISNVSHELKTPIAVLLTEAQVAKIERKNLEKGYAFIDMAEREMKRLGNLVESLLVLARTDINRNRLAKPVAVNDLVLEAVQHCRLLAEHHKVRLVAKAVEEETAESLILGDPQLLQVMLENLVRNAIRHSPEGAPVAIEAELDGEEVLISVRDEGPGIPPEYLDRIFERGVRVPPDGSGGKGVKAGKNGSGGAGLGLAIARNVVQLHRGTIRAMNNAERGCTFEIGLPLARRADFPEVDESDPEADGGFEQEADGAVVPLHAGLS
jgi:signal transduction histidine kinase